MGNPMSFPLGLHSQGRENLGTVHWKGLTFYRELMGGTQKSPMGELHLWKAAKKDGIHESSLVL